jgi:hypothetical protein
MMVKIRISLIALLGLAAVIIRDQSASADEALFYKELNLVGGYSSRDHWVGKSSEQVNSAGFEDYRKFSNDYGDFLTTDLQARVGYDSLKNAEDGWGLQIHNAWLLYKLNPSSKLRLGHFDPAFGLEPQLDTHGTLLQTLADKDIGFKRDWGAGLEGNLADLDYKTALQLGSGMTIYRRDESYLWTGRLGTPKTQNLQYGVSLLYGRILDSMGMRTWPRDELMSDSAVLKKRAGLDSQYLFGPCLFKGEIAYGKNGHNEVLGYLGEADYTLPRSQNLEFELQYQSWVNDLSRGSSDDSTLSAGVSYRMDQNTTLRAMFSHDLNMSGRKEENLFLLQFYFFGA